MIISPPKHRHQHAQHEMPTIMAPMTASLTLRPLADAGGGGLFYSRFPPFLGDAALSLPHVLCCDARPHKEHRENGGKLPLLHAQQTTLGQADR